MNRQFPGRDFHPLAICAFVARLHIAVSRPRCPDTLDKPIIRSGLCGSCLLEEPVEQFPARAGGSTIESKGIFIEVIVQMLMTYSSLMASDQPSLNQGRHSVTERQAPKGSWGNPLYPGILHLVVTPVKGIPLKNNLQLLR